MTAPDPVETDHQSWDQFWQEIGGAARTETVRGVTITVPTDLPLSIQARLDAAIEDEEQVQSLAADLFGPGKLDELIAAGVGAQEFVTLVAWAIAQVERPDLTFREAWEQVQAQRERARAGNLPGPANRAARRASTTRSATGGGPSKRTTAASTGSARKTSRR